MIPRRACNFRGTPGSKDGWLSLRCDRSGLFPGNFHPPCKRSEIRCSGSSSCRLLLAAEHLRS
eukprot:578563-Hanusia_phi.AAC.1